MTHSSASFFLLNSIFCICFHIFPKFVLQELHLRLQISLDPLDARLGSAGSIPHKRCWRFKIMQLHIAQVPGRGFIHMDNEVCSEVYQSWLHVSAQCGSKSTLQTHAKRYIRCFLGITFLLLHSYYYLTINQHDFLGRIYYAFTQTLAEWCKLTQWNFLIGIKRITHWIPASVKSLFQRVVNCLHGAKTYLTEEVLINGTRQVICKMIKNIPGGRQLPKLHLHKKTNV